VTVLTQTSRAARIAGEYGSGWNGPVLPGLVLTGLALVFAVAVASPLARRSRGTG
jgi:hypothetical protein